MAGDLADSLVGRRPIVVRHNPDRRLRAGVAKDRHDAAGLVEQREDRPLRQQRRIQLAGRVVPFGAPEQQNAAGVRQHGQRVQIIEPSGHFRHHVGNAALARDRQHATRARLGLIAGPEKMQPQAGRRRIVAPRARETAQQEPKRLESGRQQRPHVTEMHQAVRRVEAGALAAGAVRRPRNPRVRSRAESPRAAGGPRRACARRCRQSCPAKRRRSHRRRQRRAARATRRAGGTRGSSSRPCLRVRRRPIGPRRRPRGPGSRARTAGRTPLSAADRCSAGYTG